jgi:hypothetical protein
MAIFVLVVGASGFPDEQDEQTYSNRCNRDLAASFRKKLHGIVKYIAYFQRQWLHCGLSTQSLWRKDLESPRNVLVKGAGCLKAWVGQVSAPPMTEPKRITGKSHRVIYTSLNGISVCFRIAKTNSEIGCRCVLDSAFP